MTERRSTVFVYAETMHILERCDNNVLIVANTDMYEVPDAVPPIHAVSSHVATDKDPPSSGLFAER